MIGHGYIAKSEFDWIASLKQKKSTVSLIETPNRTLIRVSATDRLTTIDGRHQKTKTITNTKT